MAVARTALRAPSKMRDAERRATRPIRQGRTFLLRENETLAHPRAADALVLAARPLRDD